MAVAISFWGSLQLGPVNVCVIQTALAHGKRQALMVATGGALPEIIYASLAVWGAGFIDKYPQLLNIFGWLVIVILLVLGIYYFFKPYHEKQINPSAGAGFLKGFSLAMFNPQLFPFWLAVLVYMKNLVDFKSNYLLSPYVFFVLGTAVGAWLLLFLFANLAISYKKKLNKLLKSNLNKIVGVLFIVLAMIELVRRIIG